MSGAIILVYTQYKEFQDVTMHYSMTNPMRRIWLAGSKSRDSHKPLAIYNYTLYHSTSGTWYESLSDLTKLMPYKRKVNAFVCVCRYMYNYE